MFIRLLLLGAFLAGIFIGASVLSELQEDSSSALQAKKVLNMVRDVSLGRKFVVDDIQLSNADASLYVFGCQDRPDVSDCDLDYCTGDGLMVCVCERRDDAELAAAALDDDSFLEKKHGCETQVVEGSDEYSFPIRGYARIQSSTRLRIEQKEHSGAQAIVISEVVG